MSWIVANLWLIPAVPLLAAGVSALIKQRQRRLAASLAVGSMVLALGLSIWAFVQALQFSGQGEAARHFFNFRWFQFGDQWLELGWVLDPLAVVML
ncbi:MAG: NADH-quinone oxidoreductase subunit L, partial [Verrucomicrobia bacterium]